MTVEASRRQRIVEWFRAQLLTIAIEGGFATDAGQAIYTGFVPQPSDSDPDVIVALLVGDDTKTYQRTAIGLRLPIEIHALAKANVEEPWIAVEQVLGDIKKAIEQEDRRLGGLIHDDLERGVTRTSERTSESLTVGVQITYSGLYKEAWGAPDE